MVSMDCEEHDRFAAGSQFVTHLTGRMLSKLGIVSTPINTVGFETLLKLMENTCKDSFDLFFALYRCTCLCPRVYSYLYPNSCSCH